jgi:hypothetical protein
LTHGESEAAQEDWFQSKPELLAERANGVMIGVDEFAAEFAVKWRQRRPAGCPDAAADAVARLEHANLCALSGQVPRCRETGETGTGDDHANPAK